MTAACVLISQAARAEAPPASATASAASANTAPVNSAPVTETPAAATAPTTDPASAQPDLSEQAEPAAVPLAEVEEAEPAAPDATGDAGTVVEPPLPAQYRPGAAPEAAPVHVAPRLALVLGARAGVMFPLGAVWQDGTPDGNKCCNYQVRSFGEFASAGPMVEIDIGARINRHYTALAIWEYSNLGPGALKDEFGGQERGSSHLLGAALRFATNPDDLSFVVELAVGWRRFQANWQNGTSLSGTDNFLNARIGAGADLRLNRNLSLSALFTLGGGVFSDLTWKYADGSKSSALGAFDQYAQHVPVTLQIGAHFDAFRSAD